MLKLPVTEELTSHINAGSTRLGQSQSEPAVACQDTQQ